MSLRLVLDSVELLEDVRAGLPGRLCRYMAMMMMMMVMVAMMTAMLDDCGDRWRVVMLRLTMMLVHVWWWLLWWWWWWRWWWCDVFGFAAKGRQVVVFPNRTPVRYLMQN